MKKLRVLLAAAACLVAASLAGAVPADEKPGYEAPRIGMPSFWEGSVAIGLARTTWVYYHVSNIPKASVLYVPNLPTRPQDSPHWPKGRAETPRSVDMGEGMSKLYDPQVEEAKETWQTKWEGWKKWAARNLGLDRFWEWVKGLTIAKNKPPEQDPDIIFLPDADSSEVTASTIYRYSPPDEFVQFLAKESIFIPKNASEKDRAAALEQAKKEHKFLFLLDRNTRPKTIHNGQWRMGWTVHIRPHELDELAQEKPSSSGPSENPEIKHRPPTSGTGSEQLDRVWTVLRQTDLATGYSIDELVDQSGESGLLWPVGKAGARLEVWHLRWGTMQWNPVSAQSIGPDGKPIGWGPALSQVVYESQTQTFPVAGQWGDQRRIMATWWLEEQWGEPVYGMGGMEVIKGPVWRIASVPAHDGWMRALLWTSLDGGWQWLSMESCRVRPISRVELDWPDGKPVPPESVLTVRGRFFTPRAGVRLSVGGKVVREWVADKPEWQTGVDLTGLKRKTVVTLETQAPWKSVSEIPSSWPWVRLAQWPVAIQ